jgi:hypothetical protein
MKVKSRDLIKTIRATFPVGFICSVLCMFLCRLKTCFSINYDRVIVHWNGLYRNSVVFILSEQTNHQVE